MNAFTSSIVKAGLSIFTGIQTKGESGYVSR